MLIPVVHAPGLPASAPSAGDVDGSPSAGAGAAASGATNGAVAPAAAPAELVTTVQRLSVAGPVYLCLDAATVRAGPSAVPTFVGVLRAGRCHVGPFPTSALDAAAAWLDAGALTVVLTARPVTPVPSAGATDISLRADPVDVVEVCAQLPAERVSVEVPVHAQSHLEVAAVVEWLAVVTPVVAGTMFLTPASGDASWLAVPDTVSRTLRKHDGAADRRIAVTGPNATADAVAALHRASLWCASACGIGAASTAPPGEEPAPALLPEQPLCLAACFALCARTDRPDGLYTTVVADERGMALGLVYSSLDSMQEALRSGRGVYHSRSRGGLWRKGDSSGAVQLLVKAALDCDSDAVLFRVVQLGDPPAFCHLNTRTCWGDEGGVSHLERVLASRRREAPAGSYTKRLFDDATLLRSKLVEEAQELSEAVEPDHVAAEAADVLYFAMVRCAAAGVTLADVERHLDRRSLKIKRRPGNAKPARIAAAEALLAAKSATTSS